MFTKNIKSLSLLKKHTHIGTQLRLLFYPNGIEPTNTKLKTATKNKYLSLYTECSQINNRGIMDVHFSMICEQLNHYKTSTHTFHNDTKFGYPHFVTHTYAPAHNTYF